MGGEKRGDPRIPGRRRREHSWGTPLQAECLKARKDCDPLTVRKTGQGDCEPRNATKDGCAGNVRGEVTGQVQLLPAGEGESYEGKFGSHFRNGDNSVGGSRRCPPWRQVHLSGALPAAAGLSTGSR